MSFLNIRGKMIHCEECGHSQAWEYQGGNQMTQIGDQSIYEQIELHKDFMPSDYDPSQKGYYFHQFAICQDCLRKSNNEGDEPTMLTWEDFPLNAVAEESNLRQEIGSFIFGCANAYRHSLTPDQLPKMSPECYQEIVETKFNGNKKEKRRMKNKFVSTATYAVRKDFKEFISARPEWPQFEERSAAFVVKFSPANAPAFDYGKPVFIKLNPLAPDNLNDLICYELTARTALPAK